MGFCRRSASVLTRPATPAPPAHRAPKTLRVDAPPPPSSARRGHPGRAARYPFATSAWKRRRVRQPDGTVAYRVIRPVFEGSATRRARSHRRVPSGDRSRLEQAGHQDGAGRHPEQGHRETGSPKPPDLRYRSRKVREFTPETGTESVRGELVVYDDGEPVKGQWEPIISVTDREAVTAVIGSNPEPGDAHNARKYLGTGILRCDKNGCGGRLRAMKAAPSRNETVSSRDRADTRTRPGEPSRAQHEAPLTPVRHCHPEAGGAGADRRPRQRRSAVRRRPCGDSFRLRTAAVLAPRRRRSP